LGEHRAAEQTKASAGKYAGTAGQKTAAQCVGNVTVSHWSPLGVINSQK
jgi:hypothetical protein